MAYKVFTNGSVLQASEINENLMRQSVMVFSNAAARTAAITAPVEGMLTWLEDVDRYESYTGAAWVQVITPGAWVTYTPTLAGMTLGNGTVTARYAVIGKTMHLRFDFTLGSTSAMSSQPRISLPAGFSHVQPNFIPTGYGNCSTAGANFPVSVLPFNSTTLYGLIQPANSTYVFIADITASVPATWTTGNSLSYRATLEIA